MTATTTTTTATGPAPAPAPPRLVAALQDGLVLTKRNLLQIPRVPELLFFSTIQPVMFVLLFAYVFGGAIPVPGGGNYREYLMAGIFAQTMAFAAASTSVGSAEDLQRGLIDRFRSLPVARSAVLLGRTVADTVRNACIMAIMVVCGLFVGWRIRGSLGETLAAFGLLLLFSYTMAWLGAIIGLAVRDAEAANVAGIIWIFPLTFLSNAFVPVQSLPALLEQVALWNPVSATVSACRDLFGNPDPFPVDHAIAKSLAWSIGLLLLCVPLAARSYRAAASR